jgi:hypothetical protein
MKKVLVILSFYFMVSPTIAQNETFDITTFTPPIAWVKEIKGSSYISFTTTDNQNNSYCRICIYASTNSKGDINNDFESEWEELVAKKYQIADSVELTPIQKAGDWDTKIGVSKFNFNNNINTVMLNTSSGFNKTTSILILYNNTDYESAIVNFISSINYNNPERISPIVAENNNTPLPIIGKWARSVSISYNLGGMNSGYVRSIYDFKSDNTYTFTQRTWGMTATYIYIVKETGILKTNNNQITLTPQKSIIESWEHNGDALVKLMATSKRPLETMAYQFIIKYDDLMKDWNLILQANKETLRDGKFGGISPYPNGWFLTKRFSDYDLTACKIF